jgi:hypothetical protein
LAGAPFDTALELTASFLVPSRMVTGRAIWEVALWLAQKHGDAAPAVVKTRLDRLVALGAPEDEVATWRLIDQAVMEIGRTQPDGQALH